MSTNEKRVTFITESPHDRGKAPGHSSLRAARFAIQEMGSEGPRRIEVYDPSFLSDAVTTEVEREQLKPYSERKHSGGVFATISGVGLTHSDAQGTYGRAEVLSEATPEEIDALIRSAFTAALNPIGNTALAFAFSSGEQQQQD